MLHVFTISSWRSPVAAQLRFVRFFVLALAERSSSQPQALSGYGGRSQGSNPWQTQVMVLGVPLLEYGNGRRMVQTFCPSVLGVPISLGAIQKVLDRVAEALAPHYFAIATQTRHAPVNYIDETPRFLANALQGLWVMVSDTAAFYMIHPHRSKEAFATWPTARPLIPPALDPQLEALRLGLRDLGYVEGQNLIIEARYAEGSLERLRDLADELVRLKVDVIVAGAAATRAAQHATRTPPIVMANVSDPVAQGLVASLARPGGTPQA